MSGSNSVNKLIHGNDHPAMIETTREVLIQTGIPYVIENVVGAPLHSPLMLCGSMFPDLRVTAIGCSSATDRCLWHRQSVRTVSKCPPGKGQYHELNGNNFITCVGHNFKASDGRIVMGIDWMTRAELSQAIPPAYTEYIGRQLLDALDGAWSLPAVGAELFAPLVQVGS